MASFLFCLQYLRDSKVPEIARTHNFMFNSARNTALNWGFSLYLHFTMETGYKYCRILHPFCSTPDLLKRSHNLHLQIKVNLIDLFFYHGLQEYLVKKGTLWIRYCIILITIEHFCYFMPILIRMN